MSNKFTSLASLCLMLALFLALGWYWHKAAYPEPNVPDDLPRKAGTRGAGKEGSE